jgi:hypothetical protein
MNQVAERGGVVSHSSTEGEVEYTVNPTGAGVSPVGVLLDDVEDLNFDRHPEYLQRNVSDVGSVVGLCAKGDLETNLIVGDPTAGDSAYLHPSGYLGATQLTDGLNPAPKVGVWRTSKNANGFATVHVDL